MLGVDKWPGCVLSEVYLRPERGRERLIQTYIFSQNEEREKSQKKDKEGYLRYYLCEYLLPSVKYLPATSQCVMADTHGVPVCAYLQVIFSI